jgi:hypothetical protein
VRTASWCFLINNRTIAIGSNVITWSTVNPTDNSIVLTLQTISNSGNPVNYLSHLQSEHISCTFAVFATERFNNFNILNIMSGYTLSCHRPTATSIISYIEVI